MTIAKLSDSGSSRIAEFRYFFEGLLAGTHTLLLSFMFGDDVFGGFDTEVATILSNKVFESTPIQEERFLETHGGREENETRALLEMCSQAAAHVMEQSFDRVEVLGARTEGLPSHILYRHTAHLEGTARDMFAQITEVASNAAAKAGRCSEAAVLSELSPFDTGSGPVILVELSFYLFTKPISVLMSQLRLE